MGIVDVFVVGDRRIERLHMCWVEDGVIKSLRIAQKPNRKQADPLQTRPRATVEIILGLRSLQLAPSGARQRIT